MAAWYGNRKGCTRLRAGDVSALKSYQVDSKRANFIFKTGGLPFGDAAFVLWHHFSDGKFGGGI